MSGEKYVEPWYLEMKKAADAQSPAAIAAKAAADQVYQLKLQQEAAYKKISQEERRADPLLSDCERGDDGNCIISGGSRRRRRSRKSRKSRRK